MGALLHFPTPRERKVAAAVAAVSPFDVATKCLRARRAGRTYRPTRVEQLAIAQWRAERVAISKQGRA